MKSFKSNVKKSKNTYSDEVHNLSYKFHFFLGSPIFNRIQKESRYIDWARKIRPGRSLMVDVSASQTKASKLFSFFGCGLKVNLRAKKWANKWKQTCLNIKLSSIMASQYKKKLHIEFKHVCFYYFTHFFALKFTVLV